jgi:hypothetical protein
MTTVQLNGSCSSDPEGQEISFSWSSPTGIFADNTATPSGQFPLGRNDVTLVVTDPDEAMSAPDDGLVVIVDTTPPVITCPANLTIECDESSEPSNTGMATVVDVCDSAPSVTHSDVTTPGDCPEEKSITRTWKATDWEGNSSSCVQVIEVVDTTAPIINPNAPNFIKPPDAPISFTATAIDNCAPNPSVVITGYDCFFLTKKGKRIDKTESCVVSYQDDTITILDSGGVGSVIEWNVSATDSCGNVAEPTFQVPVANPTD